MTDWFPILIRIEPPADLISANGRLHHQARARLTKHWRTAAAVAVDCHFNHHGTPSRRLERAHIEVSIRFRDNRRRDVGNYYPTAKAIVDGLVDAHLLTDDDDTRVIGPDMRREWPNGDPRVTVTIYRLEDTP